MRTRPSLRIVSILVTVLAVGASSCGAPGGAPALAPSGGGDARPVGAICTGPVPANAIMCPGADRELASDAPRVLVELCTCGDSCGAAAVPCSYACDPGFAVRDDACQPVEPAATELVDGGDGTVTLTDAQGAVVWLQDAGCHRSDMQDAQGWSASLASGTCGLRDGSAPGRWQLPTASELGRLANGLADLERRNLSSPFTGVQAGGYWSTSSPCFGTYTAIDVTDGNVFDSPETAQLGAWPVRR